MKYTCNNVSKPVTGAEARRRRQALRTGDYVTNPAAEETIRHIAARRAQWSACEAD